MATCKPYCSCVQWAAVKIIKVQRDPPGTDWHCRNKQDVAYSQMRCPQLQQLPEGVDKFGSLANGKSHLYALSTLEAEVVKICANNENQADPVVP